MAQPLWPATAFKLHLHLYLLMLYGTWMQIKSNIDFVALPSLVILAVYGFAVDKPFHASTLVSGWEAWEWLCSCIKLTIIQVRCLKLLFVMKNAIFSSSHGCNKLQANWLCYQGGPETWTGHNSHLSTTAWWKRLCVTLDMQVSVRSAFRRRKNPYLCWKKSSLVIGRKWYNLSQIKRESSTIIFWKPS